VKEPLILAIDTSTEQAGVAVVRGSTPIAEISWIAGGNHSSYLPSSIRKALDEADVRASDLNLVVVATGPGSFNGLRVGMSFAKGLAMSLHIPLVGMGTLEAIALEAASEPAIEVWALISAGRGEVYRGRYAGRDSTWTRLGDYERIKAADAANEYRPGVLLAGPGSLQLTQARVVPGEMTVQQEPRAAFRRPVYLAELGSRYLRSGGEDQLDTLEPLYLRLSSAEEKRGGQE
jgi:tRNA threonylcarbamoyladenosine biosynthesis protein TsaB